MIEMLNGRIDLDDDFVIKEYYTNFGNIRVLYGKEAVQSVTFIDKEKRNEICDYYFSFYDIPVYLNPEGKDYLVLGGGGFTYPKYYISKYIDKNMDVVELNKNCIYYAKKYFFLDELYDKYDSKKERLKIINDNAINYINYCQKKYDFILIDLFDGIIPINEIYEDNNIYNFKKLLNENSVVVINYVISKFNINTYKEDLSNLVRISKYYKLITNKNYFNFTNNTGNVLIILSSYEVSVPDNYDYIDIFNII